MILGDVRHEGTQSSAGSIRITIDELLRSAARRRPDALALVDAENRESFTDGKPRRVTYAEADRIVDAIAHRLRSMAVPTDAVVGIQLPNIVENFLVTLGVLRAEMIAAPLPLLWRRAEAVEALERIGAKALITCGHVGAFNHADLALHLAAEVFSIRYVCAFGSNLPDGTVSFDDLTSTDTFDSVSPIETERKSNASSHLAAVTFDIGDGGIVPVARSHAELLAGGLAVLLESHLPQKANILSALPPASFAGIGLTFLPWLVSGGTLVLHHPFEPDIFAHQRRDYRCAAVILPAPVAFRLTETSGFAGDEPVTVIAAWRSPERLASSPTWSKPNCALIDVSIFGETAIVPARRGPDGKPSPIAFGRLTVPRDSADGVAVADVARTDTGTVALRGPMVPSHSFPPGIERSSLPHFQIGRGGFVDTGYSSRIDSVTQAMIVMAPPSGIASVGGYRFSLRDLQEATAGIEDGAALVALPDPLIGQRLIGNAADRGAIQQALRAAGFNPLVVAAFRDRRERDLVED
ncbi:MAG: class I adenylate-forming enzyme family protein [Xanthobacteraceae bacterium]